MTSSPEHPRGHRPSLDAPASSDPSGRRALLRGAAWSLPVVVAAVAAPAVSASGTLSTIEGNFAPWDLELAVDQVTDLTVAFIETSGTDYTGTLSLLISPSRSSDTVIATLSAFGPIVGDPDVEGIWSYSQEGTRLRVSYTGLLPGSTGIRGYLDRANGAGIRVDTAGRYLSTRTDQVLTVDTARAVAERYQYRWDMVYGTDGAGAP
jgi:hypothetical protein